MSSSFFFLKFRTWLKENLGPSISKHLTFPPELLSVHAVKYFPYKPWSAVRIVEMESNIRAQQLCRYGLPVPPAELRYGYGNSAEDYIEKGKLDVQKMLDLLSQTEFDIHTASSVLELGCAAGRMIRHLKEYSGTCKVWGTDIDANAIYWAKLNLGEHFRFATTTSLPHLPFPDGHFDLIYCGSVFTHIDDLADAWFLELRRLLSPGGRLYITIHDKHTSKLLKGQFRDHPLSDWVRNFMPEALNEQGQWGMISYGKGPGCQVFYDVEYLKCSLRGSFDIIHVSTEAYGYQTGVVMSPE